MATRSQATSELFDSRKVPRAKGIGYPSCNTEIALRPPNTKDPQGYYREIGVDPWATPAQIKSRIRELLRQHHPDTGDGDTETFNRIKRIGQVLLDPVSRERYNQTPPGMRLMDAVAVEELSKLDELQGLNQEELEAILKPHSVKKRQNPFATNLGYRYDYFARDGHTDPWQGDGMKAQLWYHFLIGAAPAVNYRRVIKVLMTNGDPAYHHAPGIMEIPRSWEPSAGAAYSLWTVVAGFRPGENDPETRLSTIIPQT